MRGSVSWRSCRQKEVDSIKGTRTPPPPARQRLRCDGERMRKRRKRRVSGQVQKSGFLSPRPTLKHLSWMYSQPCRLLLPVTNSWETALIGLLCLTGLHFMIELGGTSCSAAGTRQKNVTHIQVTGLFEINPFLHRVEKHIFIWV